MRGFVTMRTNAAATKRDSAKGDGAETNASSQSRYRSWRDSSARCAYTRMLTSGRSTVSGSAETRPPLPARSRRNPAARAGAWHRGSRRLACGKDQERSGARGARHARRARRGHREIPGPRPRLGLRLGPVHRGAYFAKVSTLGPRPGPGPGRGPGPGQTRSLAQDRNHTPRGGQSGGMAGLAVVCGVPALERSGRSGVCLRSARADAQARVSA
jgi:hypothetical protein